MVPDPKGMEVVHHDEIFAHVAALQLAGKKVGHEPTDHVATAGD